MFCCCVHQVWFNVIHMLLSNSDLHRECHGRHGCEKSRTRAQRCGTKLVSFKHTTSRTRVASHAHLISSFHSTHSSGGLPATDPPKPTIICRSCGASVADVLTTRFIFSYHAERLPLVVKFMRYVPCSFRAAACEVAIG